MLDDLAVLQTDNVEMFAASITMFAGSFPVHQVVEIRRRQRVEL